jgi:hypothetical protein
MGMHPQGLKFILTYVEFLILFSYLEKMARLKKSPPQCPVPQCPF